jgi:integrase
METMSIRKRRWQTSKGEFREAWIVDYVDQQGDQHIKHFERKRDADDYQAAIKVDIRKGLHIAPNKSPTVSEAAETWYKRVEANGMNGDGPAERATLAQYRQHIDRHIVPRMGSAKLGELTQTAIEAFRDDLVKSLSRPLARKVFTSFKSLLKASNCSHLAGTVSIGREKRRRRLEAGHDFPTPDQIKRLIAAVAPDDFRRRALLLTVAFTGLRSSELRGLRWKDIDFEAGQLHVRQRADRYNKIGAPKSETSVRTVPLDTITLGALREWKLKSRYSKPDDYVFGARNGHVLSQDRALDSLIAAMQSAKLTDKAGKPLYGLHALRHFFASWCINAKDSGGRELPPKRVQELLGHSTIAMTLDIYGHLFPSKGDRGELNEAVRQLLA